RLQSRPREIANVQQRQDRILERWGDPLLPRALQSGGETLEARPGGARRPVAAARRREHARNLPLAHACPDELRDAPQERLGGRVCARARRSRAVPGRSVYAGRTEHRDLEPRLVDVTERNLLERGEGPFRRQEAERAGELELQPTGDVPGEGQELRRH